MTGRQPHQREHPQRRERPIPPAIPAAPEDGGPSPLARADALGATILAYLITGPVVFGLIGWGLEALTGWRVLVVLGILVGMVLSLYVIWVRYGEVRKP